jgi:hypothetical protein
MLFCSVIVELVSGLKITPAFQNSAVKLHNAGSVGDGLGQWYMSWINRRDPALLRSWSGSRACEGFRIRGEKLCAVSR